MKKVVKENAFWQGGILFYYGAELFELFAEFVRKIGLSSTILTIV